MSRQKLVSFTRILDDTVTDGSRKQMSIRGAINLQWVGLSLLVEQGVELPGNNYVLRRLYDKKIPTVFMIYQLQSLVELKRDPDSAPKLHIGLNIQDIQTAFNPIIQLLQRLNIETFKVVLASKYEGFLASGQLGKIFTIYMGNRTPEEQLAIAREIDGALKALNIPRPTQLATDCAERKDVPIDGCDFVTRAFPREMMGCIRLFAPAADSTSSRRGSDAEESALLDMSDLQFKV